MLEENIKSLCLEFDADLKIEEKKVSGRLGSFIPISTYFINKEYRGYSIEIKMELGNHNLCEMNLRMNQNYIPDFEITSIDHFMNLFLRKKNILSIKTKDRNYKEFLLQATIQSNLENIAKQNSFEPKIFSIKEKNIQFVKAVYSLQLDDKVGALRAMLEFYKLIIDRR